MSTPINSNKTEGPANGRATGEDQRSQAQIDYEEGRGYVERGEAALAAASLHNALKGFEEEGDREGIANASNQLGHACLQRREYDQALEHYQRAWRICEELEDEMSLQALSLQLVQVFNGRGEYQRALKTCLELLDTYQRNNDPQGSVRVLELMAEVYLSSGDREKAADSYRTIASIHANFKHLNIAENYRRKAAELGGNPA